MLSRPIATPNVDHQKVANSLVAKLSSPELTDDFMQVANPVILLLVQGYDLNQIISPFGHSLVHLCALRSLPNILTALIQTAFDYRYPLNTTMADSYEQATPLHLASAKGHKHIIEILLTTANLNLNAQDFWGNTPLDLLINSNLASDQKSPVRDLLVRHGAQQRINPSVQQWDHFTGTPPVNLLGQTPLHYLGQIANLLDASQIPALVNHPDPLGRTPLMYMVARNNKKGVEFILGNGGHVTTVDHQQRSALHYAAAFACPAIIEQLLAQGANTQQPDSQGNTPFSITQIYNRPDIVAILAPPAQPAPTTQANRGLFYRFSQLPSQIATLELSFRRKPALAPK